MKEAELAERLAAAWARRHGGQPRVESLRRLSAGASAQTYALTLVDGERRDALVLQLDAGGETMATALDKATQAAVQQAAAEAGIPTPAVRLVTGADDGLPAGFVSAHVGGETLGKRIVHDAEFAPARQQLAEQCATALAALHDLPADRMPALPRRDAATQIEELSRLHRGFGPALPCFEAAIAWLRSHLPQAGAERLVHGDFRIGNLLVDAQRGLTGILDWELAHLGDPLEDLGWICVRSWRFGADALPVGGFATRERFFAAYTAAAGRAVDAEAVHFWELLGTLKWGIVCQWFAAQHAAGRLSSLEPALIGRRVSEVEIQILDLLEGRGP